MQRAWRWVRNILVVGTIVLVAPPPVFGGNPIGDFFKRLGNSISHPQHKTTQRTTASKGKGKQPNASPSPGQTPATVALAEPAPPPPAPTPTPLTVQKAGGVTRPNPRRDVPYGVPVPGRPGFVTSPYAPTAGLVDVRGFPPGTEVKDPYSQRVFLTP